MAMNLAARKEIGWKVISLMPDVCKTPMGSSMVPVPYPVYAELKEAVAVVQNVKFNGFPAVVYDQTELPRTIGDNAGTGLGMNSGTVGGQCIPDEKSSSVKAGKRYIVRHGDLFWMNGG